MAEARGALARGREKLAFPYSYTARHKLLKRPLRKLGTGGNLGEMEVGSLQEVGEERTGDGVFKGAGDGDSKEAGAGRNGK